MELLKGFPWRRAFLAVILNLMALSLSTTALLGSYWCTGTQKVPKPLCGKSKATKCIGVPMPPDAGAGNVSSQDVVHYSWETGDDRFAFKYFHTGMWLSFLCFIPCRGLWLCCFQCLPYRLFSSPGFSQHVLFLCLSCSMAWASFTCCMASAVTTLNTYTKTVLEFKRNHIKGYDGSFRDQPQHHQCFLEGSMQEQHMEGETLNKVPLVQDRSAQDKPASSSIPLRAEEGGSAFSPSAQQFS